MKKKLIYFILFFLLIIKVNGQEEILTERDTIIIRDGDECEQTIIMKKEWFTVDTLYADIKQKIKVQYWSHKRFLANNVLDLFADTVLTLVDIRPLYAIIHYPDGREKFVPMGKHIKKKYQKIMLPIMERTCVKAEGEILIFRRLANHCCPSFTMGILDFYVFPIRDNVPHVAKEKRKEKKE